MLQYDFVGVERQLQFREQEVVQTRDQPSQVVPECRGEDLTFVRILRNEAHAGPEAVCPLSDLFV